MAISMNNSSSGFGKWSEAQEPKRSQKTAPERLRAGVGAPSDLETRRTGLAQV
jgi:hypothetical protein